MDRLIVVDKREGDLLTRMYGRYVATGLSDDHNMTVVAAKDSVTEFMARFGRCVVADNLSPLDLLSSGFEISLIDSEGIPVNFVNANAAANNQNESGLDSVTDNLYSIEADFSDLQSYELFIGAASQGVGKWIGLIVKTGELSVVGIELNGTALTSTDEAYANSLGGAAAGSFVYWLDVSKGVRPFVLDNGDGQSAIVFQLLNTDIEDVPSPELVSARAFFADAPQVNFDGTFVTAYQYSTLTKVEAMVSHSVELNGTPKVLWLVGENWVEYGSIAVDGSDAKKVIITPTGTNGQSPTKGAFYLKLPERALVHNGAGNSEVLFTLTVESAPAPAILAGTMSFADDMGVDLVDGAFEALEGSETANMLFQMSALVSLNGTPKAGLLVDGSEDVDYGNITLDNNELKITPSVGTKVNGALGVKYIRIPADSVRFLGVGNAEVILEVNVVETPAIEVVATGMHFVTGDSISPEAGVFVVTEGRTITAIDIITNTHVTVNTSAVVTLTVDAQSDTFGSVVVHPAAPNGLRIIPTGDMGVCDVVQNGVLSIPASTMTHRGEANAALEYGLNVVADEEE